MNLLWTHDNCNLLTDTINDWISPCMTVSSMNPTHARTAEYSRWSDISTVQLWRCFRRLQGDVRKWNTCGQFWHPSLVKFTLFLHRHHQHVYHRQFNGASTRHSTRSIQLAELLRGRDEGSPLSSTRSALDRCERRRELIMFTYLSFLSQINTESTVSRLLIVNLMPPRNVLA